MSETTTTEETTMTKRPETVHDERLIELIDEHAAKERTRDWHVRRVRNAERRGNLTDALEAECEVARTAAHEALRAVHDHDMLYTRWARFWLVTSSDNGHVHRSTNCSTCRPRTTFALLPDLSGLGEADAVVAYGAILCTLCFPSAPVEWTNGESRARANARSDRDAKRAEREAKRLEKALLPDGSPLEFVTDGRWSERLTTLSSAKMWLTDAYSWGLDHPSYPPEAVELVAEAVAAKTGESVDVVKSAAAKRAAARR